MKKIALKIVAFFLVTIMSFTACIPALGAVYTPDEVTAMLEGIDTLQQMQNKRSSYRINSHYNASNASIVASHEKAREGYETYVSEMFAKRAEAQQAYDALSDEEKAQIDPLLTEKLNTKLDTVFKGGTYPVKQAEDEYAFQIISPNFLSYEISSSYIKTGDVAATFMVVNTLTTKDEWTPDGLYEYGKNNYDLAYCCDLVTLPVNGTLYKRMNLEDSNYYDDESAKHIRAIIEKSYPFLTIEEMKAQLISDGLEKDFVDSLTRSDIISAVQMAVWAYANVNDETFSFDNVTHYGGNLRMTNHPYIPNIMHDYSNELWHWWSVLREDKKGNVSNVARRSFDSREEYRVNKLVEYLYALEGVAAHETQTIVTEIEILKTKLAEHGDGTYDLTVLITVNGAILENDDVDIIVSSYSENENGEVTTTSAHSIDAVTGQLTYKTVVNTKDGDTIKVEVKGVQDLPKGVYFYEANGGRDASQTLVGVAEGPTAVRTVNEFTFTPDIKITPIEPDEPEAEIPESKRNHYIVFGKTEKIGWYSVSLDGGETFRPVFGNSNLEVPEGTEMIIKANDVFGDPFTFYINGEAYTPDENGYIRVTVDGFMLVGALGIPVIAPDAVESLSWIQKIWKAIVDFFTKLFNL